MTDRANAAWIAKKDRDRALWMRLPLETRAATMACHMLFADRVLIGLALAPDLHWPDAVDQLAERFADGLFGGPQVGVEVPILRTIGELSRQVRPSQMTAWREAGPKRQKEIVDYAVIALRRRMPEMAMAWPLFLQRLGVKL